MRRVTSGRRNRRESLRSLGGVALLHLAAAYLEALLRMFPWREPVAPPMPSRPVRPPNISTTSPGTGRSRLTSAARTARPRRRLQDAWPHIRDGISHVHGLWPSLSGFRRMNIRGRLRARSHAAEALPGSVSFTLCVMSAAPVTRIAW